MAAGWAGTGAGGSGGVVSAALVGGPKPGAGEWGVNGALSREPNASITAAVLVKTGPGTSLPLPGPSHFIGPSWEQEAMAEPDFGALKEQPRNLAGRPFRGSVSWGVVLPVPRAPLPLGSPESRRELASGGLRKAALPLCGAPCRAHDRRSVHLHFS